MMTNKLIIALGLSLSFFNEQLGMQQQRRTHGGRAVFAAKLTGKLLARAVATTAFGLGAGLYIVGRGDAYQTTAGMIGMVTGGAGFAGLHIEFLPFSKDEKRVLFSALKNTTTKLPMNRSAEEKDK